MCMEWLWPWEAVLADAESLSDELVVFGVRSCQEPVAEDILDRMEQLHIQPPRSGSGKTVSGVAIKS